VFAIGKDVGNKKLYGDIRKMTHLLVAGATGSGKSVFLTTLIISLINHYSPQQLRLILIDPKKTEFAIYQNLPHLMINEIITEPRKAVQSLGWAIGEMNRRFELFAEMTKKGGTRVVDVDEYNASLPEGVEKLPKIVIIVDELADLMLSAKKEVEERIQNITQKSRAAGIHMVIATQRPSTNVITGVIKANLPTRIAFTVATDVDSRVILDASGAQKLLGRGDMLYCTSGQLPLRAQCAYISSADTQNVVQYIRDHNDSYFDEDATDFIMGSQNGGGDEESGGGEAEAIFVDALRVAVREGSISISKIQRKFSVGYSRAGKIIEWMADRGYVSEFDGAKARKCLLSKEEFESLYGPL
jgi:S-DNA-T family DNA segregation ATPase FtsK/SpoIIIE